MKDNTGTPVTGFATQLDYIKHRDGSRYGNRQNNSPDRWLPAPHYPNQSAECLVRIVAAYNTEAEAYPGILTFRNLESISSGDRWIDAEEVMVFDANDTSLQIGLVYKGTVYNQHVWGSGNNLSMYVVVGKGIDSSYHVKLTGVGTGIDGGAAWRGLIQKEVGGAVVDNGEIGTVANYYVMYPTKAENGVTGLPEINDIVIAIPDPLLPGRWEFRPKPVSLGDLCHGCAWLADALASTAQCLWIQVLGGSGRCSCVLPEEPQGYLAKYDSDLLGWARTKMITLCCGCGIGVFKITDPDKLEAELKILGVHTSCQSEGSGSGSGGILPVVDITLKLECCGINPETGQPYAIFYGYGPKSCDNTPNNCDNVYRIKVECADICPPGVCSVCCGDESAPFAWKYGPLAGFDTSTNYKNGWWVLPWDATANAWIGLCDSEDGTDASGRLEYIPAGNGKYRLTHGGAIFELDAADWVCCGNNIMVWVSGAHGTQNTITVSPLGGVDSCGVCELPTVINVSVSAPNCTIFNGLSVNVTRVGTTNVWTNGGTAGVGTFAVTVDCFAGVWRVTMGTLCADGINPATGHSNGGPDTRTGSPFYIQFTDAIFETTAGGVGGCCNETSIGTITLMAA